MEWKRTRVVADGGGAARLRWWGRTVAVVGSDGCGGGVGRLRWWGRTVAVKLALPRIKLKALEAHTHTGWHANPTLPYPTLP
eukprot:364115-Chlamydomonas_euryale.AAC.6